MLALLGAFAGDGRGQQTGTVINSDPPGAALSLSGEYQINTVAPCRLPENITGKFKLRASLPGYESWSGDIVIAPGQENLLAFAMKPKTRIKAGLRSLFIPGWGQYYSDQKDRSFLLNVSTLGFGVGALLADSDFRKKRDDYFQAQNDLNYAGNADEIERLRRLVIEKNRQAYNAETTRNALIIAAAGLWAYNVIDALIFFPDKKLFFQGAVPRGVPQIQGQLDQDQVTVQVATTF